MGFKVIQLLYQLIALQIPRNQRGQQILVQTHVLTSVPQETVATFAPKYECPFPVFSVSGNNQVFNKKGRQVTVNLDQVRSYYNRQDFPKLLEAQAPFTPQRPLSVRQPTHNNSEGSLLRRPQRIFGTQSKQSIFQLASSKIVSLQRKHDRSKKEKLVFRHLARYLMEEAAYPKNTGLVHHAVQALGLHISVMQSPYFRHAVPTFLSCRP